VQRKQLREQEFYRVSIKT